MTELTQQERIAFAVKAAQNNLLSFNELLYPEFKPAWFHELIAYKLEQALAAVQRGEKVRLILSIPPRHGKTKLAAEVFPVWALGKYPKDSSLKFILSTYGFDLSETTGGRARDIFNSDVTKFVFPEAKLRVDTRSKSQWEVDGGGSYTAVGIGTAVTGKGAKILIMDDPHKDRAEAESSNIRNNVIEYYKSTLYSRLEGYGAVIIIMQRWHQNDLVGYLLEEYENKKKSNEDQYDEWEVVSFPAIAEEDEYFEDNLLRKAGEPLWEERYPINVLHNIRDTTGVYNWASQYQQDPILAETMEFKADMFRHFEEDELEGKNLKYYTFVDPAISQKKTADNTVVVTIAKDLNGPNIYRIKESAGKFTVQQTIDLIFKHQGEYRSEVWIETVQYQKALKLAVDEEQKLRGQYFRTHETQIGNKELRIRGLLPFYERGVIFHRRTDIEYERELLSFPRGKHDDRADAMAMMQDALKMGQASRKVTQYIPHLERKKSGAKGWWK